MSKEKINLDTFLDIKNKLEIKIGKIRFVERVPKSNKILKLEVSFGNGDIRTVMTNIGKEIDNVEDLVDVQLPFITNLEPASIMGEISEAMIMVAEDEDGKIEFKNFTNGAKLM